MKPMTIRNVIRMLEQRGFILVRSNGHMIYQKGSITLPVPHHKVISAGTMRDIMKMIKSACRAS